LTDNNFRAMPPRYQISCIKRSDSLNHHRRIDSIGGVNPDGTRWKISEAAAIAGIEAGRWRFYLSRTGRDVEIVVATSKYGSKYIKTADDSGLPPDTLLTLPECR
jgi:hypothetical protein